jgi:organic hydroperoxide reductase OsmC/OhrA
MNKAHRYIVANRWTGNLGSGTSGHAAYGRNLEMEAAAKSAPISCSSDPAFRGDPSRYNPEELLVGALSACHMLVLLHLCADAGIVVTGYSDRAEGEMIEHPDGSGEFTRVILRPRLTITDPARIADAIALNHRAHELCFIARSVNFPVEHEPIISEAFV